MCPGGRAGVGAGPYGRVGRWSGMEYPRFKNFLIFEIPLDKKYYVMYSVSRKGASICLKKAACAV